MLLTSETWTWGPPLAPLAVVPDYDDDFRLSSLQVGGLPAVSFSYDEDSLLTHAGALTLTRDGNHGLVIDTTLSLGAGQVVSDATTYTAFGEPETYTAQYNASTLYAVSYDSRDRLGRLTAKTETVQGQNTAYEYAHDPAGRLREVKTDGAVTASYTYDANGNRLTHDVPGVGTTIGTYDDQDRLLTYGAAEYEYTANGDLAVKRVGTQVTTYDYAALGNLRTVVLPSGTVIEYLVDGRNRRIGKKVDGVFTEGFVYKDQLSPVAQLGPTGAVVAQFVYGSKLTVPDYMTSYDEITGQPIATYRIISDYLGSIRLVVDPTNGAIVQRIDYDTHGNMLVNSAPQLQPFGFGGGLSDADTGLVRFGARDYDTQAGRWVAKDPRRFEGADTNLYAFAGGDPVNFVDPTGDIAIAGFLVGAGFELAVQAWRNYRDGCDLFDADNYDWWDVGVSAAVGALAPGMLNVGSTTLRAGGAIRTLSGQLNRARTANRFAKIAGRIQTHRDEVLNVVIPQLAFQAAKGIGKSINGSGDCECFR